MRNKFVNIYISQLEMAKAKFPSWHDFVYYKFNAIGWVVVNIKKLRYFGHTDEKTNEKLLVVEGKVNESIADKRQFEQKS